MTSSGRRELIRRIFVMVILVVALVTIGYGRYVLGALLLAGSVAFYIYLPAVKPPAGALQYDAGKSQVAPDWLGFVLSSLFIAFPVWAAISEPNWGTIHPSSIMLWPMALVFSSFWIIGALHASYWILIKPDRLVISSAFSFRDVPFDTVKAVRRYRRGLPKWLSLLTPFMIAKGQYGGAGALLLARDRTGMELVLKDGKRLSIADSGYDEEIIEILQALDRNDVKLAAAYRKILRRQAES